MREMNDKSNEALREVLGQAQAESRRMEEKYMEQIRVTSESSMKQAQEMQAKMNQQQQMMMQ